MANPDILRLVLIAVTGVVAGFFNVIAGGGTLLTLPMLSFIGIDLGIANATNRVSIVCQNISAISLYGKNGEVRLREVRAFALPIIAGAVVGTISAIYISPRAFRIITTVSISAMAVLLLVKPKMFDAPSGTPISSAARNLSLFGVGLYGGFLQAGVGFVMIMTLVGGCKLDIKRANIIKVVAIAIYNVLSVALFASHGMINWTVAAALAVGSVTGGNIGARYNLKGDKKHLRVILTAAVLACAAKMLYDTLK